MPRGRLLSTNCEPQRTATAPLAGPTGALRTRTRPKSQQVRSGAVRSKHRHGRLICAYRYTINCFPPYGFLSPSKCLVAVRNVRWTRRAGYRPAARGLAERSSQGSCVIELSYIIMALILY